MAKDSVQSASGDAPVSPVPTAPVKGLPRERLAATDEARQEPATLRRLLAFRLHGKRGAKAPGTTDVWPALLHPFRDMRNIRHEYPLLIGTNIEHPSVQSLGSCIDAIINDSGLDGDPRERFRRHAYQFEAALKDALVADPESGFAQLARKAADELISSAKLEESRKSVLGADIEAVLAGLPLEADISDCSADIAARLYRGVSREYWSTHCQRWQGALEQLVHDLGDILRSNDANKPEARSADHLRSILGTGRGEDLDFDRMSELLSKTPQAAALPEERRQRIADALGLLKGMLPIYGLHSDVEPPFDPEEYTSSVGEAVVQLNLRQIAMVEFFRALRVAELELENRYDPAIHDGFFSDFDATHLSEEERSLCPPVVLTLSQQGLEPSAAGSLLELLDSDVPLKVVLQLNSLDDDAFSGSPAWPVRLTGAAVSLGSAFVFQGTASTPDTLKEAFKAGAAFPGPALLSVYTSTAENGTRLPAYLEAASALEARSLPCYRFDPSLGSDQVDRMVLMNNPRQDQPWVRDIFSYFNAAEQESAKELAFTHADFLLADRRWEQEFWVLDQDLDHEALLPLDEFLSMEPEQSASRVPYVLGVDGKQEVRKVALSYRVLQQVKSVARRWRALQEAGGINNSHARALMEREQARMDAELQERIAQLKQETDSQLDQNLGELTREIVGRIAGQLIHGATVPGSPAAAPTQARRSEAPAPVAPAPAKEAAPVQEVEEEDEPISLDEPYIDTPLCTTCDDCTKMAPHIFAYNEDKQAYIKDASAGSFQEMVLAAEKCPVSIIHPGKPKNPAESNLDEWIARAKPFN
jgi:ferredoxin